MVDIGFPQPIPSEIISIADDGALAQTFFNLFGLADPTDNLSSGYSAPPEFTLSPCGTSCSSANLSGTTVYGPSPATFNKSGTSLFFQPDYFGLNIQVTGYNPFFLAKGPPGTIVVTTNLAGAAFSITGPASYSGSGTSAAFTDVPAGVYTITYGAVSGYVTPASQLQVQQRAVQSASLATMRVQRLRSPALLAGATLRNVPQIATTVWSLMRNGQGSRN